MCQLSNHISQLSLQLGEAQELSLGVNGGEEGPEKLSLKKAYYP